MNKLILLVATLSAFCIANDLPEQSYTYSNRYKKEVRQGKLAQSTNLGLKALVLRSISELKKHGYKSQAKMMKLEWDVKYSKILIEHTRGMTDHAPLIEWLGEKTKELEASLGHDVMHAMRLDDLITFNYGIPVVISCVDKVDVDEYGRHFIHDSDKGYRGLGPVTVYWTALFTCMGLTWESGVGSSVLCSPIAMGAEFLTDTVIAPALNEPLWNLACKEE